MPAISSSATTTTARLQQLLPQLFQPDTEACDRYLKVNIAPDTPALIALDQVQEAAQIPIHTVTPLPNLPPCILGVMNSRNQVLCVVDLARVLQLPPSTAHRQIYPLVTVRPNQSENPTEFALVLHHIQGVIRLPAQSIAPPTAAIVPELTPILRGCVEQNGQTLVVLDVAAIRATTALSTL